MKDNLKQKTPLILMFILISGLYFYGINKLPFLNRTDARYAEIAREMVATGDYIVPKILGTPHLHKPPLTYWLIALGLKIFGINEFGARFFLIVFSLLSLLLVFLIAKEIFNEKIAIWALIFSAVSPGIFFTSRILSTDIFLLFFELGAFYSYIKFLQKNRDLWIILFWLSLGLGFMTKGPVAILIPFLIIFAYHLMNSTLSDIKPFFRFKYIMLFSIIAFPWYLYLILSDKKILTYFLIDQIYARIAGAKGIKMGHPKPFYFYFVVLPVLLLPFFVPFIVSFYREVKKGLNKKTQFIIIWIVIPVLFFSFILTKLPTYILFIIPPSSIIAAKWIEETDSDSKFILLILGLIPLLFLPTIPLANLPSNISLKFFNLSIIIAILVLLLISLKHINPQHFKTFFLLTWLVFYFQLLSIFISYPELLKTNKKLALMSNHLNRKEIKIVSFRQYAYQLPFYTGKFPYLCDVNLEKEISPFRRILSCQELESEWESKTDFLVFCSTKDILKLVNIVKDCFVVGKDGEILLISNKPFLGIKLMDQKGIYINQAKNLPLLNNIKIFLDHAKEKAQKAIGKKLKLHEIELSVKNKRLFYEFEFKNGEKIEEVLVDTLTGKVFTQPPYPDKPVFTNSQLRKMVKINFYEAEQTALNIVNGIITEKEVEIENGVLCFSFHIKQNGKLYELLINASNGILFKISLE